MNVSRHLMADDSNTEKSAGELETKDKKKSEKEICIP